MHWISGNVSNNKLRVGQASTEGRTQDMEVFGRNVEILRWEGMQKSKAALFSQDTGYK